MGNIVCHKDLQRVFYLEQIFKLYNNLEVDTFIPMLSLIKHHFFIIIKKANDNCNSNMFVMGNSYY